MGYRNDLKGTHPWLKVKLVGTKSNRSAIGARVLANYSGLTQAQEVRCLRLQEGENHTQSRMGQNTNGEFGQHVLEYPAAFVPESMGRQVP